MPSTLIKVLNFENSKPNNNAKEKKYNTQTDLIIDFSDFCNFLKQSNEKFVFVS